MKDRRMPWIAEDLQRVADVLDQFGVVFDSFNDPNLGIPPENHWIWDTVVQVADEFGDSLGEIRAWHDSYAFYPVKAED